MKKLTKYLLLLLAVIMLYVIGFVLFGAAKDRKYPAELPANVIHGNGQKISGDTTLNFLIWNIGYAGLGQASNFFFDQKKLLFSSSGDVYPSQELNNSYLEGIINTVKANPVDFYLLQEVDESSKRSHCQNQMQMIAEVKDSCVSNFATNADIAHIPIPIFEPWQHYGSVKSGLLSISRFQPAVSKRLQLPGEMAIPDRYFQLDRCVLLQRYPLPSGKSLVVLNVHNSAHDKHGELKWQELSFIKTLMLQEYKAGNFVIAGGDWNMCPPYFRFDSFSPSNPRKINQISLPPDFFPPEWTWVYDPTTPTNRKCYERYDKNSTFTTIIDFYLISPNLQSKRVKTLDMDFAYSDHQPVWMELKFK